MGVDGIGRSGGGSPAGGVGGASGATGAADVTAPATEGAAAPVETTGVSETSPLARLERGEIDVDQYLDVRVAAAVGPYIGKVSGERLEFIKETIRDSLSNDPVVVELLRRTTNHVPAPTE